MRRLCRGLGFGGKMKEHLELHTFLEQMGFTGLSIDEAVEITLDHGGMDTLALDSRDVLMALGGKSDLDWDMLIRSLVGVTYPILASLRADLTREQLLACAIGFIVCLRSAVMRQGSGGELGQFMGAIAIAGPLYPEGSIGRLVRFAICSRSGVDALIQDSTSPDRTQGDHADHLLNEPSSGQALVERVRDSLGLPCSSITVAVNAVRDICDANSVACSTTELVQWLGQEVYPRQTAMGILVAWSTAMWYATELDHRSVASDALVLTVGLACPSIANRADCLAWHETFLSLYVLRRWFYNTQLISLFRFILAGSIP